MAQQHDYPIIRFLVGAFYLLAGLCLVVGLGAGTYLWIRGEVLRDGIILGGPLSDALNAYDSAELCLGGAAAAGGGVLGFLAFGALGQLLAMQRDRTSHAARQSRLLEEILELNDEAARTSKEFRVKPCEGCGQLGTLRLIDSGQWVCHHCRGQIRSAS